MTLEKTVIKIEDIAQSDEKGLTLKDGTWLSHDDYVIKSNEPQGRHWTVRPIIPSSMVEYFEYYPDTEELVIFKVRGGSPLTYIEVPQYLVLAMALDKSVGRFYNTYIKGRFQIKGVTQ